MPFMREVRNSYNILTGNSYERVTCEWENEVEMKFEKENKAVTTD
jgi:hypothetical protein